VRRGSLCHHCNRQERLSLNGPVERIGNAHGFHRLLLFFELVRRLAQSSERTPLASVDYVPSLDQDAPRIIQKVMSYILENFKDTVSLSEAAEISGMSESSFSRFFKKNSGNNFVDYVRKLRISHACKVLSETSIPVTEVCFEVGYNNISNFNRHFLAEKGITPSKYRKTSARKFTAETAG
jgi:AraC-like DNA-binding protein